ncbi:MAG: tRNA-dihydrouridine synthase A [Alteromonadaceae bacterium]|jgi:tRNA-dihydrouridine synthase A
MNEVVEQAYIPTSPSQTPGHRFSIAPMLDWTDRHCRYFHRQLTKHAMLYTEMVTTGAIIHGKGDYLAYNEEEHPVALQLGGSDPQAMAHCAKLAEQRGYDEININVGCPSDKVQHGMFGACLMARPEVVAQCVEQMRSVVDIPVTVKCRIGIDDSDEYQFLADFVETVKEAGCSSFTVHARKAWLKGLSPKQNREVPPLNYERVYQLKAQHPELEITINGGINNLTCTTTHLAHVDGVMIGREAYQNPYLLVGVDQQIYGCNEPILTRHEIIEMMIPYIEVQLTQGATVWQVVRHMLGIFQSMPGARSFRRFLSENASKNPTNPHILLDAAQLVPRS